METIQIIVSENPSTGYSWLFDQDAAKGILSVDAEYFRPSLKQGDRRMVGSPGYKVFTVTAGSKSGRAPFRIAY